VNNVLKAGKKKQNKSINNSYVFKQRYESHNAETPATALQYKCCTRKCTQSAFEPVW
jgi:hypothetical protein